MPVEVAPARSGFQDWELVLTLVTEAFEYQKDRIDPPSSADKLNATSLAQKARDECLLLAQLDSEIVGCVFARDQVTSIYVGKLAVWPRLQGKGIGRNLMQAVEARARASGHAWLELDTRIELVENHRTFEALGFVKTSEQAHAGYDHPTFITMRKRLM